MIQPPAALTEAVADPSWIVVQSEELVWCTWDHDHVLYHRPSGKTHFVNDAAWLLLSRALTVARPLSEVTDELAAFQGASPTDELREYVQELLLRFEELGLVRRL
jgi:PqqD family protein of HPr-rel-A system